MGFLQYILEEVIDIVEGVSNEIKEIKDNIKPKKQRVSSAPIHSQSVDIAQMAEEAFRIFGLLKKRGALKAYQSSAQPIKKSLIMATCTTPMLFDTQKLYFALQTALCYDSKPANHLAMLLHISDIYGITMTKEALQSLALSLGNVANLGFINRHTYITQSDSSHKIGAAYISALAMNENIATSPMKEVILREVYDNASEMLESYQQEKREFAISPYEENIKEALAAIANGAVDCGEYAFVKCDNGAYRIECSVLKTPNHLGEELPDDVDSRFLAAEERELLDFGRLKELDLEALNALNRQIEDFEKQYGIKDSAKSDNNTESTQKDIKDFEDFVLKAQTLYQSHKTTQTLRDGLNYNPNPAFLYSHPLRESLGYDIPQKEYDSLIAIAKVLSQSIQSIQSYRYVIAACVREIEDKAKKNQRNPMIFHISPAIPTPQYFRAQNRASFHQNKSIALQTLGNQFKNAQNYAPDKARAIIFNAILSFINQNLEAFLKAHKVLGKACKEALEKALKPMSKSDSNSVNENTDK